DQPPAGRTEGWVLHAAGASLTRGGKAVSEWCKRSHTALLSSSIGKPAFPPRPGNTCATARNKGDGRSGATRSHAQCAPAREHGEDGEHRTLSVVSTVAVSSTIGGW